VSQGAGTLADVRRFEPTSHVRADPATVWRRVVSPAGINDEMRPWMTMGLPSDRTIDDVPLGVPAGRVWLRLGGLVPFDESRSSRVSRGSVRWCGRCSSPSSPTASGGWSATPDQGAGVSGATSTVTGTVTTRQSRCTWTQSA
jgi:hypothetical protein